MPDTISREEVWKQLKGASTVMLTTESPKGLRSRPMQIVQDKFEGKLYFFTNISSPKIDEVQKDSHVCISGRNDEEGSYFSVSGRAAVTKDEKLIDKFWHPAVAAWFPKGKDDPDCALLEVDVDSIDVWESEENPVLFWYEVIKSNLTDSSPEVGRVRHRDESGTSAH